VEHGIRTTQPQPSPRTAVEPLGDLISGDAIHTNPAALRVRSWMTATDAQALTAAADARAARPAVTA